MRDQFHWQLADPRPFAMPVPAAGKLGLWPITGIPDLAVHAALAGL